MSDRPSFIIYIDEAGDPGVKIKTPEGASEWFVVSAAVVSASRDLDVVDWLRDMREAVRAQDRQPMHYRKLSPSNRERVCRMLSTKHVRLFTVASHKTNMRGRRNPKLSGAMSRGEFYNWCLRLLLERVTAWCHHRAQVDQLDSAAARLVFSERGGHDYKHLLAYIDLLTAQAVSGFGVKLAREITPGVLVPGLTEVRRHDELAGLQIVDIAASAFFQALNVRTVDDLKPALALGPRVAKDDRCRTAAGFGLLRLPFPQHGQIPVEARPIFEVFGYKF